GAAAVAAVADLLGRVDRPGGETALLTIRHGLTTANAAQRTGAPDDELSRLGSAQARFGGRLLAEVGIDAAWVSPLRRTRQTAALLLGERTLEPRFDGLCAERSYGELEGLTADQVAERYPEVRHRVVQGVPFSINPPGGESMDDLGARAARLLAAILAGQRGRTVLVVSHGNLLQQLHGRLRGLDPITALGQPLEEIWNCSLNAFRVGPEGSALEHVNAQLAPVNADFPLY
ncbi:MAG TPA: histidine phosphatase family protein, partial [Solirubrobacterales bacterium]|nr:histidine phosphatase family protein [Solirubrobacterales bacterium]